MAPLPPFALALLAAFVFAVCGHIQGFGLVHASPRRGVAVMLTASTLFFWLAAPLALTETPAWDPALFYFLVVGLFLPSVSMSLSVAGIHYLGPTLLSALASTQPVFGALIGVVLFGETLSMPLGLAILGIAVGALLIARPDPAAARSWPFWALLLPLALVLLRTAGQAVMKLGLAYIPDAYFASLVCSSVSTVAVLAGAQIRRHLPVQRLRTTGILWFAAAGALFALGTFFLNSALAVGDLVEVAPLIALVPFFSILLSVLLFRREHITPGFAAAVVLITVSVILVGLFT